MSFPRRTPANGLLAVKPAHHVAQSLSAFNAAGRRLSAAAAGAAVSRLLPTRSAINLTRRRRILHRQLLKSHALFSTQQADPKPQGWPHLPARRKTGRHFHPDTGFTQHLWQHGSDFPRSTRHVGHRLELRTETALTSRLMVEHRSSSCGCQAATTALRGILRSAVKRKPPTHDQLSTQPGGQDGHQIQGLLPH